MSIELSAQSIISAAAVLAAVLAIGGTIFKMYDWYKKQNAQDRRLDEMQALHDQDIRLIKEEQRLLVYGVLACLKGLSEQGCNGPVTKAIDRLEKHLNIEAHR